MHLCETATRSGGLFPVLSRHEFTRSSHDPGDLPGTHRSRHQAEACNLLDHVVLTSN